MSINIQYKRLIQVYLFISPLVQPQTLKECNCFPSTFSSPLCCIIMLLIHESREDWYIHLQVVMLGAIQLPQTSKWTPQCNTWWKTSGVIRTICWTFSRHSRTKVINFSKWSQHLRAMFKAPRELCDGGILSPTYSCDTIMHVLAKISYSSSWVDKYCTVKSCTNKQCLLRFGDKHSQPSDTDKSRPFLSCPAWLFT